MPRSSLSVLLSQSLYRNLIATFVEAVISINNVIPMVDDRVSRARENTEVKLVKVENELEATAANSGTCGLSKVRVSYLGVRRGWSSQVSI